MRNLKFEEEKNREMEAEMKTLKVSARRLPFRPSRLFSADRNCPVSAAAPSVLGGF